MRDSFPSVYLDHWAWRKFSESEILGKRFTMALNSRNGTLVLSWLNLMEFTKVTDKTQARAAENFLEANLPRVFFMEIEPFSVIQRENELLAGGKPVPPHADVKFLVEFSNFKPTSSALFTANDLFRSVQTKELDGDLNDFADKVVERIEAFRANHKNDAEFQSAVQRPPSGPSVQRGTRFLLRELVRTLLIDKRVKINRNHAIDLIHAIVPVSYCDFVLLDKHWETQVEHVRLRLSRANMPVPMGKVFSGKENQIEKFLLELEST